MKKITVLIPCYNEAEGIADVVKGFPRHDIEQRGFELDILVIDNNSSDNTAEVAVKAGARVITETKQGKGYAIRTGFYHIPDDTQFVVMLDGDDTYKAAEILRLVEPLDSGFADAIVGSRMAGKMTYGSMRGFNRLGNWLFSFLVRIAYGINVTDVLTGYFAWNAKTVRKLRPHIKSSGFAIEMEMITKMARLGFNVYSVPISYTQRQGVSSLHPIADGTRILHAWFKHLHWYPDYKCIAFVSDAIYPFNKGGKEERLYEVTRRLVKDGREVHVYTMKWWTGSKDYLSEGVYYHAISPNYPLYNGDKRSYKEAILFSLACFKLLTKHFDVVDVDQMPFFPLYTVRIVCWLRRKRMYATWHEVWGREYWLRYNGKTGLLAALIESISFKLPKAIISNSEHTTASLRAAGVKKTIITVPLGIDAEAILDAPVHQQKSDIMYVGRLLENKNVDLLIKAVARIKLLKPDVKCIIVGDGPERANLEVLTKQNDLGANITFLGFLEEHSEVYGLMKASKVFVQPSTREGFGLVVIEANACGLPVVTTSHSQNAARNLIIEGENGYLTEATEEGLTSRIVEALASKTLSPEQTVREKFTRYTWHQVANDVEEVLTAGLA